MFLCLIRVQSPTVLFLFFGYTATLQDPKSPAKGHGCRAPQAPSPRCILMPVLPPSGSSAGQRTVTPAVPLPQAPSQPTLPGVDRLSLSRSIFFVRRQVCVSCPAGSCKLFALLAESAAHCHFGCGPCPARGASAGLLWDTASHSPFSSVP